MFASSYSLPKHIQDEIRDQVIRMARELNVVGLMNVQMAVQGEDVYVIEANPRASRTVPFVSKCIGVSLAKVAARCMAGTTLKRRYDRRTDSAVFQRERECIPLVKFPGVDPILGPEMKSTGEVMGTGDTFDEAFAKAHACLPVIGCRVGRAFVSVRDADKERVGALLKPWLIWDLSWSLPVVPAIT